VRRKTFNLVSLAGLALVAGTAADGANLTLHVNTGLWEVTSTAKSSGMPAMSENMIAQLPPAQRAKIEASMRSAMARAEQPHTTKSCITQKDLDRPFHGMESRAGVTCKETVVSSSWTSEVVHSVCTGPHQTMDSTATFQAPSPAAMQGEVDLNMNEHGHPISTKVSISGRWLGADCGSVKPGHSD
jgi:hypothetical protein